MSLDAGLPNWSRLATGLFEKLRDDGHIDSNMAPLIEAFLHAQQFKHGLDLISSVVSRTILALALRKVLEPKAESKVHSALQKLTPKGFVTTNYDRLINGIVPQQRSWILSNSTSDLSNVYTALTSDAQFVLKLHGDIDNNHPPDDTRVISGAPFLVLASSDYVALKANRLDEIRYALHSILQHASVMFLGYGLGDPYLIETLDFLQQHCQFSRPSWFVGLKQERLPSLPGNVTGVQPLDSWDELAPWILEIAFRNSKGPRQSQEDVPPTKVTAETRKALEALSEYLTILGSDDRSTKALAGILAPELLGRDFIVEEWIVERIQSILNIGPIWASTFAKAVLSHLRDLKVLDKSEQEPSYRVVRARLTSLHKSTSQEWQREKDEFYVSLNRRLSRSGPITSQFLQVLDEVLQHLCLGFGKRMAEWIEGGVGRDLGISHIKDLVSEYYEDVEEKRRAEEVLSLVFDKPCDDEIPYAYRLLSSAFLLNSIKLDPTATKVLKQAVESYQLFLDSNVLLPLIIKEHPNHKWIKSIILNSRDAGCKLYVIEEILGEVHGHRNRAPDTLSTVPGDDENLQTFATIFGQRANCFIQGFIHIPSNTRPSFREYLSLYGDRKIAEYLEDVGVTIVPLHDTTVDASQYSSVLADISEQWSKKRQDAHHQKKEGEQSRASVLNENEARQFLHLYWRRKQLFESGKPDNVWFLSFETVLEKVYLKNPQKWGKPPTFPVSAWASFLDSRLISTEKNRKDMLTAIIKGNSMSYSLPDSVTLVRNSLYGSRVTSKEEYESVQTALSDGKFFRLLEQSRETIAKRSTMEPSIIGEIRQAYDQVQDEVQVELGERIEVLKHAISKKGKEASERIAQLEKKIEELTLEKKRTRTKVRRKREER